MDSNSSNRQPPKMTCPFKYRDTLGVVSITCHQCGMTSYNHNDIVERYCGKCHQFLSGSGIAYTLRFYDDIEIKVQTQLREQ